jgi:hypothetical protein
MHTEDDTYDALRRIPVAELESRYESSLSHLEFMHYQYVQEHKEHNRLIQKYKRRMKYRWILGTPGRPGPFINMYSTAYIQLLDQFRDDGRLDGTGWIIDDYINVLNARAADEEAVKKSNDRKFGMAGAVIIVPVCATTVIVSHVLHPVWYINYTFDIALGLLAGIFLSKFAAWKKWR